MNGKFQTPKGNVIEYVGYLSTEQLTGILKILKDVEF
jgi:hypothetical protein